MSKNKKIINLQLKDCKMMLDNQLVDSQEMLFTYKEHRVKCYYSCSEGSFSFTITDQYDTVQRYVEKNLNTIFGAAHKAVMIIDRPQLNLVS